jgi:hypothetical protein
MREFRIFYGVLFSLVLIMCFVYQSRLMPVILLILIISPLISGVLMVFCFISVRMKLAPLEAVAEKHEGGAIGLIMQSRFFLPVSPITIIGDFQSGEETDFARHSMMTDIPPLSVPVMKIPFKLPFRGEYTVRIYEYHVYDIFKIFHLRRKLNLSAKVRILPREKYPNDSRIETETDTESPASVITGRRSDTFNSLREYREGDHIKAIHWKLSAKQDELIVKQMEQAINNSAVIFCDFSAVMEERDMSRRMIDAVLETSLAITKRILHEGNEVINCWYGAGGGEKYDASEFSHYGYLYEAFTTLPQDPSEKPYSELLTLFSGEINEQHTIYLITPVLSRELLNSLEETGLAMRGGVTLVMFEAVPPDEELAAYIGDKTKIKLIEIDDTAAFFDVE